MISPFWTFCGSGHQSRSLFIEFLTSSHPWVSQKSHKVKNWKFLSNFRRKDFFIISHGHKARFFVVIRPKKTPGHIKYWPRIDPFFSKNQNFDPKHKIPKSQWEKLKRFYYCQILKFWFFKSALLLSDRFWADILYVREIFWAKSLQKTCLCVHEKLQRNSSVGSGLEFFIFRRYGFDYLGFLTNACRGAMRSKTQWIFYRDLDWWPGPQKVQFGEITGYP